MRRKGDKRRNNAQKWTFLHVHTSFSHHWKHFIWLKKLLIISEKSNCSSISHNCDFISLNCNLMFNFKVTIIFFYLCSETASIVYDCTWCTLLFFYNIHLRFSQIIMTKYLTILCFTKTSAHWIRISGALCGNQTYNILLKRTELLRV